MPRDRIKLSDAKALIASGQSAEKIAENFDIEDDSMAVAAPAPTTAAAARVANVVRAKGGNADDPAWDFFNPLGSAAKAVMNSDYSAASVKGLARVAGIPTNSAEAKESAKTAALGVLSAGIIPAANQAKEMILGAADAFHRTKAAQTTARKVQAATSGVPMVGAPIAAVTEPGIEYAEGTAPTHKANVAAVEGGVTLAAMGAGVIAGKVAGRSPAQARIANVLAAKGVPPESIPQFTPEETALADRVRQASEPIAAVRDQQGQVTTAASHDELKQKLSIQPKVERDENGSAVWHDDYPGYDQGVVVNGEFVTIGELDAFNGDADAAAVAAREFKYAKNPRGYRSKYFGSRSDFMKEAAVNYASADQAVKAQTGSADAGVQTEMERRLAGRSPADVARAQIAADQNRLSPQAALDRENLPVEEFVRQRFSKATINTDAGPEWVRGVLDKVSAGKPGLSVEDAPPDLLTMAGESTELQDQGKHVVYRDPDGRPVAAATVVRTSDGALVRDFATDKAQGLLASRAAGAVLRELDKMGVNDHFAEISPEAARFIQRAEAAKARGALPVLETPPDSTATTGPEESSPLEPPTPVVAAVTDPTPPPPALPSPDDPAYPSALRTRFSGEKGVRRAEGNVIGNFFRETMNPVEQEALSLMRDEKGNPGHLKAMLDGTHQAYADAAEVADDAFDTGGRNAETSTERATRERVAALARIEALRPIIEQAMNPTPAMKQADAMFDAYATKTLAEGRKLGVLDSSITPENYVPHLLQPLEPRTVDVNAGRLRVGGISRRTSFANKRGYPTILEAVAHGVEPRTLNAADAISVYADKHGTAVATKILVDTLKESDIGKFTTREKAPAGWAEVGEGTRTFKNDIAYESGGEDESALAVAHQALYAPPEIAKALKPITDPNYMMQVRGFEQSSAYQAYIKSAELSLSFFHMKALNITALNDMRLGPVDLARAYAAPMDSPAFVDMERNFIQHGGKTSIESQTAEAYRKLTPTSLPTRVDAIRNLPGLRQMDAAAAWTSRVTFEVMQRKFKVIDFASKDAAWIAEHPNASGVEIATARRQLARQVNAAYGGLNWEALGVRRTEMGIARALFLAPDWTYSNVDSGVQAFQGGAGGTAARWFWARSIAGGMAMTAATTYFMTGKRSEEVPGKMRDKLFNVYLGDDKDGNRKYMNMFFAGAPSDLVNLAGNIADYGIGRGIAMTIANKLAPVSRAAEHQLSNQNFMGRDIVPKGAGPVAGTVLSAKALASDLLPVPLTLTNIIQMVTDPKREYSVGEYAAVLAGGVRPRRVKPEAPEPERNSTWDIINGKPVYKGRRG